MSYTPCQKQLSNRITNSRIRSFFTCQRKHQFEYELGIRPDKTAEYFRKGSAFHLGLEIYDKTDGTEEEKLKSGLEAIIQNYSSVPHWSTEYDWACEREYVMAMFTAHQVVYKNSPLEIVAVEQVFNVPLYNPDAPGVTVNASRNYILSGKIDKIVKLPDGRLAILEFKTASDDISPAGDYWRRLRIDHQISLYLLAAQELGYPVQTIVYDVSKKPQERPLKAWKDPYKKDGGLKANARDTDETPEEYGERIYNKLINNPEEYFQRLEVPRMENDLMEFRWDIWNAAIQIRQNYLNNRHVRNSNACVTIYGKCPYFDICTGGVDLDETVPQGFIKLDSPHPELG